MEKKLYTLSILVNNTSGVLAQISRLFARTGFNIESITAGTTAERDLTRLTVEFTADEAKKELLVNQIMKMLPVHSVKVLDPDHAIRRELVMFKVHAASPEIRSEITQIAGIFRGSIIDVSRETITVSVIGDEKKILAVQELLEDFGLVEMARSGMIALERGKYTIDEETKEKGEFNYGKNVL